MISLHTANGVLSLKVGVVPLGLVVLGVYRCVRRVFPCDSDRDEG